MKLLMFLVRISWRTVALAVITGFVSGVSSAGLIALINNALTKQLGAPATLAWGFVGLCVVVLGSSIMTQTLLIYLAQDTIFELRLQLSRQILAVPLRHLEELGSHRLLAALTADINDLTTALLDIPAACVGGATILVCLIYLGWLSPIVLLVTLGFMVLSVGSYQMLHGRASAALRRAREEQDALFRHFRALTDGVKELKLNQPRRLAFFTQLLQPTANAFRQHTIAGLILHHSRMRWGQILFFVLIGLLIFVLPEFQQIDNQTLIGATLVVLFLRAPLTNILGMAPNFGRANVALQKVESLGMSLTQHATNIDLPDAGLEYSDWARLELLGVVHTYRGVQEDSHFTLGPLDLVFSRGELVFVMGGNGSGKTTFAKLLMGLYIPEAGEIRLDGQPITEANRERYRQMFSAVFADYYLFEQLLGLDNPDLDARAHNYLIRLQLDHKVKVINGTLSTVALSQGQRKRLALLTAYLDDRPFYLFDEWAADQDPLFRDIFYTQFLPALKENGKTVLVITHDDRYFAIADRIIKFDYGQLVQDTGKHQYQQGSSQVVKEVVL